ncbi:hypothetical protein PSHT_14659 [Puccinia striiformis]|uniref:Uncharacterized protein n=1 Tax=Puccinia striiformis TaxID=27350 RepID=A0A2S4UJ98_9BASI|nr:hypothetical protein PSHT_14659 [Puccinia striiformis]
MSVHGKQKVKMDAGSEDTLAYIDGNVIHSQRYYGSKLPDTLSKFCEISSTSQVFTRTGPGMDAELN